MRTKRNNKHMKLLDAMKPGVINTEVTCFFAL